MAVSISPNIVIMAIRVHTLSGVFGILSRSPCNCVRQSQGLKGLIVKIRHEDWMDDSTFLVKKIDCIVYL